MKTTIIIIAIIAIIIIAFLALISYLIPEDEEEVFKIDSDSTPIIDLMQKIAQEIELNSFEEYQIVMHPDALESLQEELRKQVTFKEDAKLDKFMGIEVITNDLMPKDQIIKVTKSSIDFSKNLLSDQYIY